MRCTLKNIAEATGFTVNTVSRALKDKSDISVATRERVKRIAAEMGYIPNIAASSLRSGSSKTVCILFDSLTNPYYAIMTDMLSHGFNKYGYTLMIFTQHASETNMTGEMAQNIISHGADALVSFLQIGHEAKKLLSLYDLPTLVLGRDSSDIGIDSICTDDEEGGYIAAKHLIENGRKKILHLGGLDSITCAMQRLSGAKRAMSEAGMEWDEKMCLRLGADGFSGRELLDIADSRSLEYDALLCFNDQIAFEALDRLLEKGIRCPQDVAIVGYDNVQRYMSFPYRLTTVDTDNRQTADVAVEVLLHKLNSIKDKHRPFNKISGVKLIKGVTT